MNTVDRIDEIGMLFAEECQEAGLIGFAIRATDDGNVRLVGLQLPHALVAKWLRQVATAYEEQAKPKLVSDNKTLN